jgi:Protein of unknown function (DUF3176)
VLIFVNSAWDHRRCPHSQAMSRLAGNRRAKNQALLGEEAVTGHELDIVSGHDQNEESRLSQDVPSDSSTCKSIAPKDEEAYRIAKVGAAKVGAAKVGEARQLNVFKLWWTEIAALCVAICAFGGIFALIYTYREPKPQPSWPSQITLNTVISILSVILKTGIVVATAEALSQQKWVWFRRERHLIDIPIFDQATRGPWGSLVLLLHPSTWGFMSIFGAVIMVLAVAIGPFAQRLLSVRNCMIPSQTTFAIIPRQATYFDFGEYSFGGPYYDRPPFSMQSSIYAAIYAPQANTVPIICASGNCSFPEPYHTFAYCSRCKDVSNQLRHTAGNNSYNTTTESNYTLPSGTHVYSRDTGFTSMYMRSAYQSGNHTYEVVWGDYKQLQNCTASQKSDPASSWQCQGYGATECSIKPCIRTYVAEVRDAKAEERLLHSTTDFDYTSVVHVPCLTGQQILLQRLQRC